MNNSAWKRVYERVIRHKKRIIDNINNYINDDVQLEDDFINYCIHCFHLSEWIDYEMGNENAKNYAKQNEYLVLCGGIANLSKHFIVNKYYNNLYEKDIPYRYATKSLATSSTGFSGNIIDSNIPVDLKLKLDDKIIILVDNKEYKLLDVLNKSIQAWDDFIIQHNL